MKLMKKTLVTLAVTLGISGALSPAVNAATKTTNASISVLNIITMADRVYFSIMEKRLVQLQLFRVLIALLRQTGSLKMEFHLLIKMVLGDEFIKENILWAQG
ncbi:hypothetical protein [Lactococcus lactis]|uniref:Uncharacterized protein n=1 Tax=Lactococcus lactis TaxID=1358 RepID=A0AAW5TVC6_9LACT|nr:hypothetical protein [Lactococcus lactis]MCW2282086.1 hypothetical protein [Lactococcus lactis]